MLSTLQEREMSPANMIGITHLQTLVKDQLSGRVRDFKVLLDDRGIILRGYAPTYYAKQLAQHAVMKATPLPILANEIEVF